jgi:hypothetical protein
MDDAKSGRADLRRGRGSLPEGHHGRIPPREVEFLLQIRKQTIQEIRYLDPREATFKFGTGYSAGVFLITTKR